MSPNRRSRHPNRSRPLVMLKASRSRSALMDALTATAGAMLSRRRSRQEVFTREGLLANSRLIKGLERVLPSPTYGSLKLRIWIEAMDRELGCLESFRRVRSDHGPYGKNEHEYEYTFPESVDPDLAFRTALGIILRRLYQAHP